jgi:2-iminoacetate synthase ThiH
MDVARREEIEDRVYAGDRLTGRDSEELAACDDLAWLGRLADDRRSAHHGDRVTFLIGGGQVSDSATGSAGSAPAPAEVLRRFAVARLAIIGPRHVTCSTADHTTALAQLALNFGVDDLVAPADADRDEILHLIWDAGFRPVERDAEDNVVREYDPPVPLAERRATPQQVWA